MKDHVGVIIWALFTFFIATAFTVGYYNDLAVARSTEYRCYMHIEMKDGWYTGNSTPTYTGGELEKIKSGSVIDGFVVSRIKRDDNAFYFDESDNPTIEASKMSCFK